MSAQTVIDSAKAQPAPTQQDYQRLVESEWLPGSTAEAWGRWHTQLTVSGAIRRVLKPGGRAVFAAWGPPGADTYTGFLLAPLFARKELPPPPPDLPFPLRFAAPGSMADALRQVGVREVEEQSAIVPCQWPGAPEEVWRAFYDLAVPMRPYIDSFSREERAQAFQEGLAILPKGGNPERTNLTVSVNYAVATK